MTGANRLHKPIDASTALIPDFLAKRRVPGSRISVVELIRRKLRGRLAEFGGLTHHGLDELPRDAAITTRDLDHFRPEGTHVVALLEAKRV